MPLLADSHCHILDPRLICASEQIVANMHEDGLEFIVEVSAGVTESHESVAFACMHKNVYCTIGVHPHMIAEYNDQFEYWAKNVAAREKLVAFGEIGLDYYHLPHPKPFQREIFARQIRLAHEMKLPIVIHTRDAFAETMEVLIENKDYVKHGLLFHCFSEGYEEVNFAREHFDAYFAFGGAITYTPTDAEYNPTSGGSIKSIGAIRAVPIDRILLETDAPYLNPKLAGGKKLLNEPKNVRYVAEYIAEVLDKSFEYIATETLANTKRFFGIAKS